MRFVASRWWLVLLLVFALAFTFGTLHRGEWLYAPATLLYHFEPWRGMPRPFEPPPWDVLVWDGVAQFYIWRDLVRFLWLSGEVPLWNPYALCGTPLPANSQSAPFYLPHLLVLPLPTALGMGVLAAFHLFWAGLGLGLWLWQRGLRFGALMGALLWMFSLFFVAWLPLSSVPATMSWFGWLLLGLERVRANGWRSLWAFSLPLGMMLLAGHLQFAFYGVLLSLLYAIYLGYETRGQGGLGQYALAVGAAYLLGGGLAAFQLLPVLEFSAYSHRQAPPTEAGYQAYVRNALPLFHLIVAWFPDAYGNPRTGTYWGAVHYAELAMAVGGGFGLWLALMGIQRKGQSLFWLGVGLLSLLIALGTPLTRLLYFYLPGFSATGSPARILCLWAFSIAVLAAHGVEHLERWWRALLAWIGLLALALLLVELTLPQGVSRAPLWERVLSALYADALAAIGLFAISVIALHTLSKPRTGAEMPRRWIFSRAGGLTLVSLALVSAIYQAAVIAADCRASAQVAFPPLADLPKLARGERIAVLNERWSLYEPPPARMPPNTPLAYRLPDVGGYDSLLPRHYKRFLDLLNGQDSAPIENGNMLFVKRLHPDLARLRVRAVLTPDGWQSLPAAQAILQPIEVLPDEESVWQRLQVEPFPERIPVCGEAAEHALRIIGQGERVENILVEWQEYRATYLRLRVVNPSKRHGWLLITDTWYPGWEATVNGKTVPLLQANGAFRAVPIPSGEAIVEMRFVPRSFWVGALLCAISIATLLAMAAHSRTLRYT
ncbi:MAG: YfhO family protein [Fimbriimonadales bacterium]|nr:YfhO family protein [Fimbriimonadales bacterium]MDW8051102.1 YfhO family protein [Armatimonadota bacterium]